jgi:predicted nucleic acid-binding Zn finger protein
MNQEEAAATLLLLDMSVLVDTTNPKYDKQWVVQSYTDPKNKVYRVSKKGEIWSCSCPAWIFQRKALGDCKHIQRVKLGGENE